MISKIAKKIVYRLCDDAIIEEDDVELYLYGFFILLSHGLCFLEVIIFGALFDVMWESILFILFFMSLRSYAGGFHARKEITCIFCTSFAMLCSTLSIRLLECVGGCHFQSIVLLSGTLINFTLGPLDTIEKPLNDRERQHFKIISLIINGGIMAVALGGYWMKVYGVVNAATISVGLEGTLLIIGKQQQSNGFTDTKT